MKQKKTLEPLISINAGDHHPVFRVFLYVAKQTVDALTCFKMFNKLYQTLPESSGPEEFINQVLNMFQISHSINPDDLKAIPSKGPTVVVANHPFGGLDGMILASILSSMRKDVKFLVNHFLGNIPELRPLFFMVDPFGRKTAVLNNRAALRQAIQWVKNKGLLVVFPAGEVSHFRLKTRKIEDPAWDETVVRIIRLSGARVIPVYFKGRNSLMFQALGVIHPVLRTLMLPREMIKKRCARIELKIGSPISYKRIKEMPNNSDLTAYLRFRTYLLGNAISKTPGFLYTHEKKQRSHQVLQPIVKARPTCDLVKEIEGLPEDQCLAANGNLSVFMAFGEQIPNIMHEIGRLREVTFRKVGEGTGQSRDIDRFDNHYTHLFVWNQETDEVVGAYRFAPTDEVVKRYGKEGLYTHTLFKYQKRLLWQMGPALEMSRSFVRTEYQKNYTPLLLLWKGIGRFIVRYPRYKILFGAVSITNEYKSYSRRLMTAFLENNGFLKELAQMVQPRTPFAKKSIPELKAGKSENWPEDIDELSSWISDIETDGKGVPVLLKQYLKLGGKLLSFNIDPSFGNVLDGLIMVDLSETDPKLLKRYMESDGYDTFMSFHKRHAPEISIVSRVPAKV